MRAGERMPWLLIQAVASSRRPWPLEPPSQAPRRQRAQAAYSAMPAARSPRSADSSSASASSSRPVARYRPESSAAPSA